MTEKPILFSAPMVRAILDRRKTQTRRVVKPQPSQDWTPEVGWYSPTIVDRSGEECPGKDVYGASDENEGRVFPYGAFGSRLWVRETHLQMPTPTIPEIMYADHADYDVCVPTKGEKLSLGWRMVPSIHMPRWASRITLEITDVRIQRLQEISEDDARAEGACVFWGGCCFRCNGVGRNHTWPNGCPDCGGTGHDCKHQFEKLWDSINAKTHPWSSNLWVWAITFEKKDAR